MSNPLFLTYKFTHTQPGHISATAHTVTLNQPTSDASRALPQAAPGDAMIAAKRANPTVEGIKDWGSGLGRFVAAVTPSLGVLAAGVAVTLPIVTSQVGSDWPIAGAVAGIAGGALTFYWHGDVVRPTYEEGLVGSLKAALHVAATTTLPAAAAGLAAAYYFAGGWGLLAGGLVGLAGLTLGDSICDARRQAQR